MSNRDQIEEMCRAAGLTPEAKRTIRGKEVCIADGFSRTPAVTFKRLGVSPGEFPHGAYVTMWWLSKQEGALLFGEPLFFDALHDLDIELSSRKRARINSAILRAQSVIESNVNG